MPAELSQYMVRESLLQGVGTTLEHLELVGGELVEAVAVGTHEMTEHRARHECLLVCQCVYELRHILVNIKA